MLSDEQVEITRPRGEPWNPLGDDGDALRLAVKLGLDIMTRGDHGGAYAGAEERGATASAEDNHCAAIRHAIVRVAAEIGHTMSEYLTPLELHQLTGYARSGQQRDALDAALAAPAQPFALLVRKKSWNEGQWECAPSGCPEYGRQWADERVWVYTAPQPAAQALDAIVDLAQEAHRHWDADRDAKGGKLLMALSGYSPGYDKRADALHATIAAQKGNHD